MKLSRLIVPFVLTAATLAADASTASAACSFPHNARPASRNWPSGMSSLTGRTIRTGRHACFERVVIEFSGTGQLPGRRVEYQRDPVPLSPSDETVFVRGNATLVIKVASWMGDPTTTFYTGPSQIFPTNVRRIKELRLIENFEGLHQWAVGLDRTRPFRVFTLTNPPRLVIDIGTS